eukprot:18304-Heterococcus_DN1.PRE.1
MAWGDDYEKDDEQEADEEDDEALTTHNDHIISHENLILRSLLCVPVRIMRAVLIDGRSNMQESSASDPSSTYMHLALKSAVQVMKNKVIMSSKHTVGITFFGAAKDEEAAAAQYLWEFQPLQALCDMRQASAALLAQFEAPSATCIRTVENLIKEAVLDDFQDKYKVMPAEGPVPLRQAILECSDQFRKSVKQKEDYKRIFLLTNQDLPLESDPDERARIVQLRTSAQQQSVVMSCGQWHAHCRARSIRCATVAHDCAEAGANITVYGMNRGPDTAPFDYSKFYVHIMPPNGDDFNDRQLASQ